MSHHILINGQEVETPESYSGFKQDMERDWDRRFVRIRYPDKLKFLNGPAYTLLRALFVADLCSVAKFEAYQKCGPTRYQMVDGEIIVADSEFNLPHCSVDVQVQDDTIGSRIANNFRVPDSPEATVSKNAVEIEPAPALQIEVFDPLDPLLTYLSPARTMYDWYDCITHAVQYVSDGRVTVRSDWYEALPTGERFALVSGIHLRTGVAAEEQIRIKYPFEKVWLEIATRHNLWMAVTRDNEGNPQIRIEPEEVMFSPTVAFAMTDLADLVQGVDTDRQYSAVLVGDEDGIPNKDAFDESLPYVELRGFSEERFHFSGACNMDTVLELQGEFFADSNVIQRIVALANNETEYDNDVVIIQYNAYTMQAVKGDYLNPGSGPYLYNETFLNVNILNRYNLPSSVGQYFDVGTAEFRASHPAAVGNLNQWNLVQPPGQFQTFEYPFPAGFISFPDDFTTPNQDPGGNWNGLIRYTAPAQGFYQFGWTMPWQSINNTAIGQAPALIKLIFAMQRFDSGNVFISGQRVTSSGRVVTGTSFFSGTMGWVLNAGDYVEVQVIREVTRIGPGGATAGAQPLAGYSAFTNYVAIGGGVITSNDPLGARVIKYECERHIPPDEWQRLVNDPTLVVQVGMSTGPLRTCHPIKASHTIVGGKTTFELIATKREPL